MLEPYEGKLSRTVLRGERGSNALDLPDIEKQGDFFVESPIILLAAIIWYLKIYKNGIYCTFPHAVELLNKPYSDLFTVLTSYPELENYLSPFMDAWLGGAAEQLMGQIASAKIPLSRMISPHLYWVMSDSEFTLDINNPEEPKILCVGNNPDRQSIYGAALGIMTYVFRVFSPYECAACCALLIVSSIPEWLDLISHRTERIRFMREEEQRLANSTKPE